MIRRPPRSPLFPSTTLFRSVRSTNARASRALAGPRRRLLLRLHPRRLRKNASSAGGGAERSEGHPAEPQAPCNLLCPPLLEKKKEHAIYAIVVCLGIVRTFN